jgi:hypothetical protein
MRKFIAAAGLLAAVFGGIAGTVAAAAPAAQASVTQQAPGTHYWD